MHKYGCSLRLRGAFLMYLVYTYILIYMATLKALVLVSTIVKAPEVNISCQYSVTPPICRPLQFAFFIGASFSCT